MTLLKRFNPLHIALLSWGVTLGNFLLGQGLLRLFDGMSGTRHVLLALVILALMFPVGGLALLLLHYKESASSLTRVVILYLGLISLCANTDFNVLLHFGRSGALPFHGIDTVWRQGIDGHPPQLIWPAVFLAIVDCLHFSTETLATVGYGDIYPTAWYAKLAVDVQILMGLGVTVLTVGRHFADRSARLRVGWQRSDGG